MRIADDCATGRAGNKGRRIPALVIIVRARVDPYANDAAYTSAPTTYGSRARRSSSTGEKLHYDSAMAGSIFRRAWNLGRIRRGLRASRPLSAAGDDDELELYASILWSWSMKISIRATSRRLYGRW